jgi:hypothetical protein
LRWMNDINDIDCIATLISSISCLSISAFVGNLI